MSTLNSAEEQKPSYAAHIGLDWADQKHFWTMLTADGKRSRGEPKHTPEAIEVWAVELARLEWFDNMSTPLVGDLLKRWPELPKLQKASAKTLRRFFDQHNCRSEERIQQRLEAIGQAVPATTDAALLRTGNRMYAHVSDRPCTPALIGAPTVREGCSQQEHNIHTVGDLEFGGLRS